jgi:hypothetical protein
MTLIARTTTAFAASALALLLTACGTMRLEAGAPFDPDKLESVLRPGVSTQLDVKAALGEPYGKGGAFLPFHDAPRITWTYFQERGSIDMGKGDMNDERVYCFVFFAGDKFDSYMWFTSALAPVKK